MKLYGWSASDTDGCYEYRIRQPLTALRNLGHATDFGTKYARGPLGTFGHDCDVFIGQRVAKDDASEFWQSLARRPDRPRMVYELDDDLFSVPPGNPAHEYFKLPRVRQNIAANIRCADRVTVSTSPLADVVRQVDPGADVRVIPNSVPSWLTRWARPDRWDQTPEWPLTIGWAGSATHAMDWAIAAAQVSRFVRRRDDVELHMVGANYLPDLARHTPWSEKYADYIKSIDFDIGLAPLRDTRFNASKSDLRVLELSALGIPCVASAVGPYVDTPARLVRHDHDWGSHLWRLTESSALRQDFAALAREWARARTIERVAPLWLDALTDWGN